MDRGSSKHSPRVDDEMAEEIHGTVQGRVGGRAEEWKMAEPSGEDQPDTTVDPGDTDDLSRFGSYVGRSAFPGRRAALEKSARELDAPDDVLDRLGRLDPHATYRNVTEAWEATR